MIKYFPVYTLFLMFVFHTSCGQNQTNLPQDNIKSSRQRISQIKWYSESVSKGVIIQNSFPKGGPYTGPTGKNAHYSFLIFFTRVINETATPLELTINFPADSFATGEGGDVYLKLFLPPDTMTLGKEPLYGYGVTSLESFLDFT